MSSILNATDPRLPTTKRLPLSVCLLHPHPLLALTQPGYIFFLQATHLLCVCLLFSTDLLFQTLFFLQLVPSPRPPQPTCTQSFSRSAPLQKQLQTDFSEWNYSVRALYKYIVEALEAISQYAVQLMIIFNLSLTSFCVIAIIITTWEKWQKYTIT